MFLDVKLPAISTAESCQDFLGNIEAQIVDVSVSRAWVCIPFASCVEGMMRADHLYVSTAELQQYQTEDGFNGVLPERTSNPGARCSPASLPGLTMQAWLVDWSSGLRCEQRTSRLHAAANSEPAGQRKILSMSVCMAPVHVTGHEQQYLPSAEPAFISSPMSAVGTTSAQCGDARLSTGVLCHMPRRQP
jgi:hypothetical protein